MNYDQDMVTYDMFLRFTDKVGNAHVHMARVWDGERYFSERLAELAAERAKDRKAKTDVQMITQEQYLRERA